ncbi:MAG: hypothetical protein JWO52_7836 [Gammaproteobacteria bacterium]|nr:hypothetical protein [Gammaproteobacteria bacterium]
MKPQLITMDHAGEHNKDLKQTRSRLMKGGSWKKQRIVVILPAADSIPAKVSLSHWSLCFPPNNGVVRILAQGMEVGDAYSSAIEQILANAELAQWEFLLTIEHDNCPPADGVLKLIEQMEQHPEFACIGGLYFTKGPGGAPQIWGDPKDPVLNFRPQIPDLGGGLVECCGTGMGFNLWRLSMFKDDRLRRPWFKTQTENGVSTQDLYAWTDFRKYGYRCAIDCSVKVGHYDMKGDFGPADTMW